MYKATGAAVASVLLVLVVQAPEAVADPPPVICGHEVHGAILAKYQEMASPLGCPMTDELTNPDGVGKRQQFQGGTIYWHPTLSHGAHPVWGKIGELWGQYSWEDGAFGYPVTDERRYPEVNGKIQYFSNRQVGLFWSPGRGDKHATCTGECVGYQMPFPASADWVKQTTVSVATRNGDVETSVFPTGKGFVEAGLNYRRLWDQVWANAPFPRGLTAAQADSMYKQLACHATYDIPAPVGGGHLGGASWDLESWLPDVSWAQAMNPLGICNWK